MCMVLYSSQQVSWSFHSTHDGVTWLVLGCWCVLLPKQGLWVQIFLLVLCWHWVSVFSQLDVWHTVLKCFLQQKQGVETASKLTQAKFFSSYVMEYLLLCSLIVLWMTDCYQRVQCGHYQPNRNQRLKLQTFLLC